MPVDGLERAPSHQRRRSERFDIVAHAARWLASARIARDRAWVSATDQRRQQVGSGRPPHLRAGAIAQELEQGLFGHMPTRLGPIDPLVGSLERCVARGPDGQDHVILSGVDLRAQRPQLSVVFQAHPASLDRPKGCVFAPCQRALPARRTEAIAAGRPA